MTRLPMSAAQLTAAELAATRQRAEQGDADAQASLGAIYVSGQGIPQNYKEAARWLQLAAEQGHVLAMRDLITMYRTNQGVDQDIVEAHKWANLAASHATGDDHKEYADTRDTFAKMMTLEEVAEAQKRATEWQEDFDARQ